MQKSFFFLLILVLGCYNLFDNSKIIKTISKSEEY